MHRTLTKTEKKLLFGFATSLLSDKTHNHILNFMELESGLSSKYFMCPLLGIVDELGERNQNALNTGVTFPVIDEIILSDDENEVNISVPSITSSTLRACEDDDFFEKFCIKKASLQALEDMILSSTSKSSTFQTLLPELSLQVKILMSVWILGNQEPFQKAAHMFNISVTDCETCFISICSAFAENMEKYIKWPSTEEADTIANAIDEQYGFPGVVGIIGSARIKSTYSNQISKDGSSILQLVCDHNTVIHDATVGPAGMDSVSGVFDASSLYKKLISKKKPLISPFKHLIGSVQYPQLANLLTPYCGEDLTYDEEQFNSMHESVRKIVDGCFNALITRFKRLQSIVCKDVDHIRKIVLAACFLHNFLLDHGDHIACTERFIVR